MKFSASLGGAVGVSVENGEAARTADGTTTGGPAEFPPSIDGPNGRYYFSQGAVPFTSTVTGGVGLQLPLYPSLTPTGWNSGARHLFRRWHDSGQRVLCRSPQPFRCPSKPPGLGHHRRANLSDLIPSIASFASGNVAATG